ncbi:MAG TPA: hypothetical protein ENI87_13855, partial [bacterium]|nr:hypothetical protein [bacterium]
MQNLIRVVLATASTLAAPLYVYAQCPPGAAMPHDVALETVVPAQGPARTRMQTGTAALAAGDAAAARTHLLAALEFHPSSAEILFEVVRASADDPDPLALWSERFVRASIDDHGRFKPDRELGRRLRTIKAVPPLLKPSQELAGKRVAAIRELARFVQRQKPTGRGAAARALLVHWASELLLTIGQGAPIPVAAIAERVEAQQHAFQPEYEVAYQALAEVMRRKLQPTDAPTTGSANEQATIENQCIRAARILAGLDRQVAFKDLEGPRPNGPGKLAADARALLAQQRARAIEQGRVWTVTELEAMSTSQRLAFTEQHRDWHHPGIALSPTGRYRIETICGHETLLGAAKTIELHHERLVRHYGKDPFIDRPGVVRIVPERGDMDTEGAPYWWAAGFQAGDRTTVRFAWSNIVALGHTLTHELTHRFDGVLRPFLPAWYSEGHADWTGNHYARMTDKDFAEDYLRRGTAAHTFYRGYGGKEKLEQLLTGEIEEYRDNYFAGYSLYTFLRTWPPGAPKYIDALARFERNARAGRKDPLGYFTKTF